VPWETNSKRWRVLMLRWLRTQIWISVHALRHAVDAAKVFSFLSLSWICDLALRHAVHAAKYFSFSRSRRSIHTKLSSSEHG
jgi:hypothetical protein